MPRFRSQVAQALYERFTIDIQLVPQELPNTLPHLVLHVSEGCNLSCSYCFADEGKYGGKKVKWMSPEKAVASVNALLEVYGHVEFIKFFGGEPLLNLDVIEAVASHLTDLAQKKEIPFMTAFAAVTNMTVCNERSLSLVKKYDIKLTGSIDGPQVVHDAFRVFHDGRGSFEAVDANIKTYLEKTGQPSALEVVYNPCHLEMGMSMVDVHTYLESRYGPIHIFMHPMMAKPSLNNLTEYHSGRNFRSEMYSLALAYGQFLVRQTREVHAYKWLVTYLRGLMKPNQQDAHCDLGVRTITVAAAGTVHPCYMFIGRSEYDMAEDCTPDVLRSERFRSVQQLFLDKKKTDNPDCAKCSIVKTCHACPGSMLSATGSISAELPVQCNYSTALVEGVMLGLNELGEDRETFNTVLGKLQEVS